MGYYIRNVPFLPFIESFKSKGNDCECPDGVPGLCMDSWCTSHAFLLLGSALTAQLYIVRANAIFPALNSSVAQACRLIPLTTPHENSRTGLASNTLLG